MRRLASLILTAMVVASILPIPAALAGTPTEIAFTQWATGTIHDVAFDSQPKVRLTDSGDAGVEGENVTISIGSGVPGAVLTCAGGLTVATDVDGYATFSGCSIDRAGTYTLAADGASLHVADPTTLVIGSGQPTAIMFTSSVTGTRHGVVFSTQPAVHVADEAGYAVEGANVTLAIRAGTGTAGAVLTCADNTVTTNGAGNATWTDCSIDLAGSSYHLDATAGTATGHDDAAFDIYSGLPVTTAFTTSPSLGTAGAAFGTQPVIHVTDEGDEGVPDASVTLSIKAGTGALGATLSCTSTTTVTTDSQGDATFAGCKIDKAATGYRLHAAAGGATASDSVALDIIAGAASSVAFTTQPAGAPAGARLTAQPVVHVADDHGNAVSGASVGLAITPATGAVGANLACTSNAVTTDTSGDAVFAGCSIDLAGTGYHLDATVNTITATSTAFTVSSGSPTTLTFTTQPSGGLAGAAFGTQPAVHAADEAGHPAVGAAVTLEITPATGGPDGSLGCTHLTVTTNGSGDASFEGCSITVASTDYQLRASAGSATPVDSSAFEVTPDVAVSLAITGFPATTTAGVAGSLTVTARDQYGNTATDYTGTVHFTSSDASLSAHVPANYTFEPGDSGTHSFSATFATAGSQSITVDDGVLTSVPMAVTVDPAAAASLILTAPATAMAGSSFGLTVTATDAFGNTDTSYAGMVHFATSDPNPAVALPTDYTFVPGDSGTHTFASGASLATAGAQTVTAADGTHTSDPASVAVTAANASELVFTTQPGGGAGGTAWTTQPVVSVLDAYGNEVTTADDAITLVLGTNPGAGALTCADNPVNAVSGVARFAGCRIDAAGAGYAMTASASRLTGATSSPFNVTVGAVSHLVFATGPSAVIAGSAIGPAVVVTAKDAGGNTVTSYGSLITISSTTTSFTASTVAVSAVAGVATFGVLKPTTAGAAQRLTASDGPRSVTSGAFTVSAGAASNLSFGGQPAPVTAGEAIRPAVTVRVQDAFGNTVVTNTSLLTIGSSTTGFTGDSVLTVAAVSGVATFSALKPTTAGSARTISVTGGALSGATSGTFTVSAAAASKLAVTRQPSATATAGSALAVQPQVAVQDPYGNKVTSSTAGVTLTFTGSGTKVACTSNPVAAVAGIATFSGCTIPTSGTFTFSASSGAIAGTTTTAISVAGRSQAISPTSTVPARGVPGRAYAAAATATSGLPVVITVHGSPSTACSISGSTVTFLAAGTCQLDFDQAGDGAWAPAPRVSQAIRVDAVPVCPAASAAAVMNVAKTGTASCTDADAGETVTLLHAVSQQPAHGTASITAGGAWTYTPAGNYVGSDSFRITASDGFATAAPATVTLTVANHPVAASSDLPKIQAVLPSAINVLANDSAGTGDTSQPLRITAVTQPAHGRTSISGQTVVYDPAACYTSPTGEFDIFYYTVSDGLTSATTAVAVTIVRPGANGLPSNPITATPTVGLVSGGTIGSTGVPVKVAWCAALKAGASVKGYRLDQSADAGTTWSTVSSATTTASATRYLKSSVYRWQVRTTDSASRVSAWATSATANAALLQENNAAIVYGGSWSTKSVSSASGGKVKSSASTSASAKVTMAAGARQLAVVGPKGSGFGSFKVYVDGVYKKTVSESSTTSKPRRILWVGSVDPGKSHTLKLVPASTKRVYLDAIITLK